MGFCLVLLWNAKKISYKKEESLIDCDEYLLILRKKNAKNDKKRNAGKKKITRRIIEKIVHSIWNHGTKPWVDLFRNTNILNLRKKPLPSIQLLIDKKK